ncbi:FERM domain containing protein [Oopsacas minuta]|uniref:FERM domain containing protein n=1 Tax=Oopsacas minuta TaxID=111878 RepID=A0AAV7JZD3_9METZ|nr:FERM domain containing protein [Oopsacas minuta]
MPQETCFIPVDISDGSSPSHIRSSGRWKRKKQSKTATFMCQIFLPDGTDFNHMVPKKATGRELTDYVFWRIDLREKEYFGLKYENKNGMKVWLDSTRKIRKQIPKKFINNSDDTQYTPCDFHLQVKYFTPDPSSLREEFTRYLFFLHVRRDILEGKLPCSQHHAAKLFSYSIQSELGDFDGTRHLPGYTCNFLFMPNQSTELERAIAEQHRERQGMSQTDAELHFLTYTVLNLEFYGLDSYPVTGSNKEKLQLGMAPSGIKVYKDWKMIALFAWGRVLKVSQKRKRITLSIKNRLGSEPVEEKYVTFELDSKALCEVLYDNLIDYLQFYRMRMNIRESRDCSSMLAKFRYSARFMKKEPELHTSSQVIQPVSRSITPSPFNNIINIDPPTVVNGSRSVKVNAEHEGSYFQKSQSIGGYGYRRDHPDIPSLSSEPPYLTFRSSLPKVPPKMLPLSNKPELPNQTDDVRSISPEHRYSIVADVDTGNESFEETLTVRNENPTSTPYRQGLSPNSRQQQGLEIKFIHHDLSFESTDSHSNDTRSSTATPPSPGQSLQQISQYLAHKSPVVEPRNSAHSTPEKFNESYNVSVDQINESMESNEQRCSVVLEPPDDFSTSPEQQQTNTNDVLDQYLTSYTSPQKKSNLIGSLPPTPPKRISSYNHNIIFPEVKPVEFVNDKDKNQSLLVNEIKLKFQKENSESFKLEKLKSPPPIKPKKRYNTAQIQNDVIQNEINESLNKNKTFNLPQTPYQLTVQNETDSTVQLVNTNTPKLVKNLSTILDENLRENTGEISLLQDITQELLTRHNQTHYLNMDNSERIKLPFIALNSSDGIPPPSPIAAGHSPKHMKSIAQHPTRATHSYTAEGLILSEPSMNTIERSKSPEKVSKINAPLYTQQSLTKTLELQPKTVDKPPELPPRSNETFEITNSLPAKVTSQNSQQNTQNINSNSQHTAIANHPTSVSSQTHNFAKKTSYMPQSIFTQQQQHKPMGYRENSFQNSSTQNQRFPPQNPRPISPFQPQSSQLKPPTYKPPLPPPQQPRNFQTIPALPSHPPNFIETPPNPPLRPGNFRKYPTNIEQQPTITNYPTSHWV